MARLLEDRVELAKQDLIPAEPSGFSIFLERVECLAEEKTRGVLLLSCVLFIF